MKIARTEEGTVIVGSCLDRHMETSFYEVKLLNDPSRVFCRWIENSLIQSEEEGP